MRDTLVSFLTLRFKVAKSDTKYRIEVDVNGAVAWWTWNRILFLHMAKTYHRFTVCIKDCSGSTFYKGWNFFVVGICTLWACQNVAQTLCFLNTISVWLVPFKRLLLGALNAEYSSHTPGPGLQTCLRWGATEGLSERGSINCRQSQASGLERGYHTGHVPFSEGLWRVKRKREHWFDRWGGGSGEPSAGVSCHMSVSGHSVSDSEIVACDRYSEKMRGREIDLHRECENSNK